MFKIFKIKSIINLNALFYTLKNTPLIKNLFTNNNFINSKGVKRIFYILSIIISLFKNSYMKILFLFLILGISNILENINGFPMLLIAFTFSGGLINSKLLFADFKSDYFINLIKMSAKKYLFTNMLFQYIMYIINYGIVLAILGEYLNINFIYGLILIINVLLIKAIMDYISISYFIKQQKILKIDSFKEIIILTLPIIIALGLSYFKINMTFNTLIIIYFILFILGIFSFIKLYKYDDYIYIHKKILHHFKESNKDIKFNVYTISDKDVEINNYHNKKGFELFNWLFFQRHRSLLLKPSYIYSLIILGIFIILFFVPSLNLDSIEYIHGFLLSILYFINISSSSVNSMYSNCDKAMLKYNFYRHRKTIIMLFNKRLKTLFSITIIPSLVFAILSIILLIYKNISYSYLDYIMLFTTIILLTLFYTIHYLGLYYLLQPFDKDNIIKKPSFTIINLLIYFVSYEGYKVISQLRINLLIFFIIILFFTITYTFVIEFLVYKIGSKTFKINN